MKAVSFICHIFLIAFLSIATGKKLGLKDYMLAGALATATTDFILYPLDTVKVTLQSNRNPTSVKEACKQISKKGVPGGFFNGAIGYATLDGCSAAIFFAIYEEVKFLMSLRLAGAALGLSAYPSAAVAFLASTVFLVPAELVKTRMQTTSYNSIWDCVRESTTPAQGGLWGLYTGFTAILVRDLPYFCLQLGCYDNIKSILGTAVIARYASNFALSLSTSRIELLSSVAAGFITGFLTTPMDVVTARLITQQKKPTSEPAEAESDDPPLERPQSNNYESSVNSGSSGGKTTKLRFKRKWWKRGSMTKEESARPYTGLWDCVQRMAKEEGPQVFFLGAVTRVAWIAPFTAISLGLNERIKRQMLLFRSIQPPRRVL